MTGWSSCQITGQTSAAYGDVISAIDTARLPYLPDSIPPGGDSDGGERAKATTTRTSRRSAAAAGKPSNAPASRPASFSSAPSSSRTDR